MYGLKLSSIEYKENTVFDVGNVKVGEDFLVIAGPCSVESREQVIMAAGIVKEAGANILRGGAYKPRTSPYSFQGLGRIGLEYLKEAGDKYNLPVITEVVDTRDVFLISEYVDILQIGARNMQNFNLLKELGHAHKPIILKRGLSSTYEEWLMSAEYIMAGGNNQVILCERGIRTFEKYTRNTLDLTAIPVIKRLSHLPIIVDPSHATGLRDKVEPMSRAAVAAGCDGLIIEVHHDPDRAVCDGAQSLYPWQYDLLYKQIKQIAPIVGKEIV